MALYEHVLIGRQDLSVDQVDQLAEEITLLVRENGGTVEKTEYWGLRNLAYRVRKNRKGHYVLLNIDAPASTVHELERRQRLNEDVLRFITIRVAQHDDEPSPVLARRDREERRRARTESDVASADSYGLELGIGSAHGDAAMYFRARQKSLRSRNDPANPPVAPTEPARPRGQTGDENFNAPLTRNANIVAAEAERIKRGSRFGWLMVQRAAQYETMSAAPLAQAIFDDAARLERIAGKPQQISADDRNAMRRGLASVIQLLGRVEPEVRAACGRYLAAAAAIADGTVEADAPRAIERLLARSGVRVHASVAVASGRDSKVVLTARVTDHLDGLIHDGRPVALLGVAEQGLLEVVLQRNEDDFQRLAAQRGPLADGLFTLETAVDVAETTPGFPRMAVYLHGALVTAGSPAAG